MPVKSLLFCLFLPVFLWSKSYTLTIEAIDGDILSLQTTQEPVLGQSVLVIDQGAAFEHIKALAQVISLNPLKAQVISLNPFADKELPYVQKPLSMQDIAVLKTTYARNLIIAPNRSTYEHIKSGLGDAVVFSSDIAFSYLKGNPSLKALRQLSLTHLIDRIFVVTRGQVVVLDGYTLASIAKQDLPPQIANTAPTARPFFRAGTALDLITKIKYWLTPFSYYDYYESLID